MFCQSCGRQETDNPVFCRGCGQRLVDDRTRQVFVAQPSAMPNQSAPLQAKVRVNRVGRVLSGLYALWTIIGVTTGLTYYAESGLVSELVVDIISSIVALACLLISIVPEWISRRLKIRLESGVVFAVVLILLIVIDFVAGFFGPVPPGGWWNYGT